jgi:hypothetical protein
MATTYEDRKKVYDDIKYLQRPEQEELVRILRKTKESYTENSNGIFFDLSLVSEETFLHIKEYLHFCLRTRQEHEQRLKTLEDIRFQCEHYVDEEAEADAEQGIAENLNPNDTI